MEQKTAEEYLKEKGIHPTEPIYWDLDNKTISLNELLDDFGKQQQEIAVEKALKMASERATAGNEDMYYSSLIDKQSILSLKPEILKELEK